VISIVGIEWRDSCGGILSVVVDEFCEGKELVPVVLLIITKDAKVLLKDLVNTLSLAIRLRMKSSGFYYFLFHIAPAAGE